MALLLDPSKTILYFVNWRDDGSSENFPDYRPAAALKGLVDHAHALGFHVTLHVDTMGADPRNPDYQTVKQYQFRYPDTLALYGWLWTSPPSTPARFAYIDPASSAWRALLLSRIDVAIQAVHPDAIHLDSIPGILNDGNGPIEGMNAEQGLVQLHRDLVTAYPDIVFDTEGIAEPSVPYCRWPSDGTRTPAGSFLHIPSQRSS